MKHFMEIAGRRMAYLDEGQGPVLLFGHSYLWDSAMWAPQIEALKGSYRCIVPELWGHGDSDLLPEGGCTLATLARDHLALLDALGVDEFVLVGLSIGGMWGVELARMAPARLKGLVLMDSFVGLEPQITCERYLGMLAMIEQHGTVPTPIIEQAAPIFFANQPDATLLADFKARLAAWPAEKIAAMVAVGRSFVTREDRIEWLEEITVPALVMTGCEDKARPVLEGYLMAEVLACRFKEIPAAGHISTLENPAFVNQALAEFLSAL
ncbi:alpha/beta fold hydrolase [Aeromonas sobria]|uniref:2-succinyl-6-hydroxy-2, 4-cyclohexadiene-1-carboxylate synthase n=1 Tax=Aeromonas sobria TaxID=646 RepID=A0A1S2D7K8_AERSO|nr:alpha/beta fold hydrolase [Aeromonas sobria]MBS4685956.1 alpha/beta fold hydrolase [Aeromonas sobria]OHY96964.1 2-succinyl-6-hydroxy-2,4-cyclohexadiene-1-carboxylate synthase [Aeromonas sobria]